MPCKACVNLPDTSYSYIQSRIFINVFHYNILCKMLLAFYRGLVVRTKRICRFFNALQLLKKKQQIRLVPIQPLWKTYKILQWIVKDVFEIDVLYKQLYEVNMATDILMYTYLGAMAAYEFPQCCVLAIDCASILAGGPPWVCSLGYFCYGMQMHSGAFTSNYGSVSRPLLDRPLHF